MKLLALILGMVFVVSCSKGNDSPSYLPESVQVLCAASGTYSKMYTGCGNTVWVTPSGILIAGTGFATPSFSGLNASPSGQCILAQNAEARRGSVGDTDFCDITVAQGAVTGIEDSSGYVDLNQ
jgi:hypothetical protein